MWSDARRLADWVAERVWAAGFAALPGVTARRWESPGGERVLIVAPHPDDEAAGCAGVVRLHVGAGDHVTVLHVTDGRQSRALGLDAETMAVRRKAEAAAGARALGVQRWEWLGLPEGRWADGDLAVPLAALLDEISPRIIYAPSRVDFHPEHVRVARELGRALETSRGSQSITVRVYQIQVPLGRTLVNLVASTGSVEHEVRWAFDRFETQRGSLLRCHRLRRYAARRHRIPGAAEEFWQVTGDQYARLHLEEPVPAPWRTFRGLRASALSDPLAFLRGAGERRRFRLIVGTTTL